ncbi:MAG TPA: GNAT family N-acetyltransferase [Dongiaceae bacterium]
MIIDNDIIIRPAAPADAAAISSLILAALRRTNAADYPEAVIARLATSFGEMQIARMVAHREMFVASHHDLIIGTIGFAGGAVRSLFVAPNFQQQGIGRQLIEQVEYQARHTGIRSLTVAASLTATGFYRRCGFSELRPVNDSGIAMVLMHKWLQDNAADRP